MSDAGDGVRPADAAREVEPPEPLALYYTLNAYRLSGLDPTARMERGRALLATRTPQGPATLLVARRAGARALAIRAWGEGAAWAVERAPVLLGADDDPAGFPRPRPAVAELHRRFWGMRIGAALSPFEAIVRILLRQRVTYDAAARSWARLVRLSAEPAPGPGGLLLPPARAFLAELPGYRFHQAGVDTQRARVIRRLCEYDAARPGQRLRALAGSSQEDLAGALCAVPGIGPWTAGMASGLAFGNRDAVVLGDLHLPRVIAWLLARETRADDERMLALLEPFRGHRFRLFRLIWAGNQRAPRL